MNQVSENRASSFSPERSGGCLSDGINESPGHTESLCDA